MTASSFCGVILQQIVISVLCPDGVAKYSRSLSVRGIRKIQNGAAGARDAVPARAFVPHDVLAIASLHCRDQKTVVCVNLQVDSAVKLPRVFWISEKYFYVLSALNAAAFDVTVLAESFSVVGRQRFYALAGAQN